ncbi:espin-like, partial [Saccostrea cucullata]
MVTSQIFTATTDGNISFLSTLNPEQLTDKIVDDKGANCCHYASRAGRVDVIEYLVQNRHFNHHKRSMVGSTPAHDAAASGKLATVQWLLKQAKPPLTPDDQDGTGATVLHLAARYGHASLVEWILDNTQGDLAMIKAASGALPLHFAASGGSVDTVQILLQDSPRSVNMQMTNGATPIYIAAQSGHLEVLKLLVQKGGTVKIHAYDGMSCLHAASQSGHLDCVKFL